VIEPLWPEPTGGWLLARLAHDGESGEALSRHQASLGTRPIGSAAMLAIIEASGLRGRGGAGFPTGVKWRAVAQRSHGGAVVLVNGVEADPLSRKDRALIGSRPHLVLDGAIIAAESVRATHVIIAINRGAALARQALAIALRERRERMRIDVVDVPSRYVAGEETALVQFVNGGPARPTVTPPRPFEKGVRGRSTLVQNAETLAWAGLIARRGDAWYRSLGTPASPGAVLVTVDGGVPRPGVYELPASATIVDALGAAGCADPSTLQAVLAGGYFGTWVTPVNERPLGKMGAGVILALPPTSCGLTETARIMSYLAGESAQQCGPCFNGLPAVASAIAKIAVGQVRTAEVDRLRRWLTQLSGHRGACRHPDGAIDLLKSALRAFEVDLNAHLQRGACRGSQAASLLPVAKPADGWR
jgi:NADH:ubiquinone oxidoreductase subunit F (NADH-binding)